MSSDEPSFVSRWAEPLFAWNDDHTQVRIVRAPNPAWVGVGMTFDHPLTGDQRQQMEAMMSAQLWGTTSS